jgi:hypothetical protein
MLVSKKRAAEIAAIADKDIDTSDIPEAGEEFFRNAELRLPEHSAAASTNGSAKGKKRRDFQGGLRSLHHRP